MGFLNVAFLPTVFPPHFSNVVVEENTLAAPHVLKLWLGVSTGMLPVNHPLFVSVEFH